MDREKYIAAIKQHPQYSNVICEFDLGAETITYSSSALSVHPDALNFKGTSTQIHDEELVRAFFILELLEKGGYYAPDFMIELERSYPAPGRPKKGTKGTRADVIVQDRRGAVRLYVELKTPEEYCKTDLIHNQLFLSSKYEDQPPKYLVWATVEEINGELLTKCKVIDHEKWTDYTQWRIAAEPAGNTIPSASGNDMYRCYANVAMPTDGFLPLDHSCDEKFFSALVSDLHNVLWGGGGTSSNEVFAILAKLLLCKAFDEKEAHDGKPYKFQIEVSKDGREEPPADVTSRMNKLYAVAAQRYLGVAQKNPAFDSERISNEKIAYAVRSLQGISITRNDFDGDLLGRFFEEIVAHGFTQTRGQFFTPAKIVEFMLELANVSDQAKNIIRNNPDGLGVRRFPYVIDPSCGVGTFLNSYMRKIVADLYNEDFKESLTERELEAFESGFAGRTHTSWAKNSLYGIESNSDLGLAAKVNMILHGDGSMNTFVKSGLLAFDEYVITDRPQNVLSMSDANDATQNNQFDLVLSNPPFSVKLTEDDKNEIREAFSGELGITEDLFIERWSQLLRPGGLFCCVLPESVLDTSSQLKTRMWLMTHFKIKAVVSLPYSAFKPYTSVKTCVVLGEKRSANETQTLLKRIAEKGAASHDELRAIFREVGLNDEPIFMAEPQNIGYKRRKGLPDLECANELPEVARRYNDGYDEDDPNLGFFTTLGSVLKRRGARLDPKYRWLWDIDNGEVHISNIGDSDMPLSVWYEPLKLRKIAKGLLDEPKKLVDLESVNGRTGLIKKDRIVEVDAIGSEKVSFEGSDLLISKLEPYLGKVVIDPPQDGIGSTEWIGLKCKPKALKRQLGYFLMLPEMLEAFRRLQSGKRHARFDIQEVLELKVDANPTLLSGKNVSGYERKILAMQKEEVVLRAQLDGLYRDTH